MRKSIHGWSCIYIVPAGSVLPSSSYLRSYLLSIDKRSLFQLALMHSKDPFWNHLLCICKIFLLEPTLHICDFLGKQLFRLWVSKNLEAPALCHKEHLLQLIFLHVLSGESFRNILSQRLHSSPGPIISSNKAIRAGTVRVKIAGIS